MEIKNAGELIQRAREYAMKGEFTRAKALFQEAIELDPTGAPAWTGLGLAIYDSKGDPEQAMQALQKAVGLDPGSMLAWRGLGLVLQYMKKDHEGAVKCYEKCLAIDPGNEEIRQLLKTAKAKSIVDMYHSLDLR